MPSMPTRSSARALRGRSSARALRGAAAAALALAATCVATSSALAFGQVEIVSQAGAPAGHIPANTHYFTTIQAAVDATTPGDWVLIEPGTYDEEVKVAPEHGGIWIRGMNRNTVLIDGNHEPCKHSPCPEGANGIEVVKASDVWIENLTVANFDRATINGEGGNEIWWNGGANSHKIGARGWFGRYLTAYDTGFNGGYGIFTNNEIDGLWEKIYASGFNDSGIYIGACQECRALVREAVMENNALGYSGSNSGGALVIEKSKFVHNTDGLAPNSENPGDGPPPQDGQCHRANVEEPDPTPRIFTTRIKRCTIFRDNVIGENNNLSVPANASAAAAPWGVGVELPGVYADLVEGNQIYGNPSDGVLAFEYPNPFPPVADTIYFQLAGNELADNTFNGNGYGGGRFAGDVMMEGGLFGSHTSTNNCLTGNSFVDAVYPADIEGTWGCQHITTPNPNTGYEHPLQTLVYLLELQYVSEHRAEFAEVKGQPVPPAQETMPDPCLGVPRNPLCP